jgi:hypothetical protein
VVLTFVQFIIYSAIFFTNNCRNQIVTCFVNGVKFPFCEGTHSEVVEPIVQRMTLTKKMINIDEIKGKETEREVNRRGTDIDVWMR